MTEIDTSGLIVETWSRVRCLMHYEVSNTGRVRNGKGVILKQYMRPRYTIARNVSRVVYQYMKGLIAELLIPHVKLRWILVYQDGHVGLKSVYVKVEELIKSSILDGDHNT